MKPLFFCQNVTYFILMIFQAARSANELRGRESKSSSGGTFTNVLWGAWLVARTVGAVGFALFVYVAVSEDAFRSRGIDVYRLAH